MHPDQLRSLLRAVPFTPFLIRVNNDRSYFIDHPEVAILTRDGRTAAIAEGEHVIALVAMTNVCSLEPLPR